MAESPLLDRVRALVHELEPVAATVPAKERLAGLARRLDEPLRVAIAGKVKAGKSTLLNALVGQELAPTDAGECTRIVTWYRDGVTYRVTLYPHEGAAVDVPFQHEGGAVQIDLQGRKPEDVERLIVDWPSQSLKPMTLIDTPGIASLSVDVAERAKAFLIGEDDDPGSSDAVLYLMRHLHSTDVSFLESFRDEQVAGATPINAIGILSRADEVGVGKLDAMKTAERIAERYRSHPDVRRLCQTVLPVAGLIAQAAATLREDEFAALARIAQAPEEVANPLMLSADRFVLGSAELEVPSESRERLLGRLGLFGIRLSVALIRKGTVTTAPQLAQVLMQHSGLPRLRAVLMSQFAARRDVLKARAALLALDALVRENGFGDTDRIAGEVERIQSGAHEFAEVRLLNALRAGGVPLPDDAVAEAERLLGAQGTDVASRLGVAPETGADEIRSALYETLGRWQARAENPLGSREAIEAARILVRTSEGLLAAVTAQPTAPRP